MAAKPKLSLEEWNNAKSIWEADPRKGFQWLIEERRLPVSAEALRLRSKSDGWFKGGKPSLETKTKLGKNDKTKLGSKVRSKEKTIAVVSKCKPESHSNEAERLHGNSLYKPEYAEQAEEFCKMGATDATLAEQFEVDVATINRWKIAHPDFRESLKAGKDIADAKVASALFKSATGGHFVEEDKLVSDGEGGHEVVTLKKQLDPAVSAQIFWLKNRKAENWKDKVEVSNNIKIDKELLSFIETDGIKRLEDARKRQHAVLVERGLIIDGEFEEI